MMKMKKRKKNEKFIKLTTYTTVHGRQVSY